jgi:tRNA nucleotidyltransferase (CCA-adding enzyme)
MKFKISKELVELSNIFKAQGVKLFIVGGFVRDSLLGFEPTDIDLASEISSEDLFKILDKTNFQIAFASKKLGTTIITKNSAKFEHTTFRAESYKKGGYHSPDYVEFINDIKIDAKRRDFTINSIYYDLQDEQIVDFFKGQKHIKKRKIKAIISPKYVFKSDGLRILRMIRLAGELDFKIANKTYKTAKKMVTQLKDISKERLFKEFELILHSDFKYGLKKVKGAELLVKIGAIKYIFPELLSFEKVKNLKKLAFKFNYYNRAKQNLVLEAFILDLCLHIANIEDTKARVVANKILSVKNTGISKEQKQTIVNLVKAFEQSSKLEDDYTTKAFIQDHEKVICKLVELLYNSDKTDVYNLIIKNYNYMKENKMPISLKELKVNGTTLKEHFKNLDDRLIGKLLNRALKFCLLNKNNNTKVKILNFLDKELNTKE